MTRFASRLPATVITERRSPVSNAGKPRSLWTVTRAGGPSNLRKSTLRSYLIWRADIEAVTLSPRLMPDAPSAFIKALEWIDTFKLKQ